MTENRELSFQYRSIRRGGYSADVTLDELVVLVGGNIIPIGTPVRDLSETGYRQATSLSPYREPVTIRQLYVAGVTFSQDCGLLYHCSPDGMTFYTIPASEIAQA